LALEKHPKVFDALYINMIKASEASGTLDSALERLAVLGENDERIRLQIKSATRYPIIVILAIVIAFLILTTFIVPRFAKLYHQFNAVLPLPTQILLAINYLVTKFWWLLIMIMGFFIFLVNKFINTKIGRPWWDDLKLRIPVFGPLVLKLSMSRFTRITGTLMQSGLTILNILDLTKGGVGNVIIARTIDQIKNSVNEGKGMAEPMKASKMFPVMVVQMVAVGEETGKVDELLLHVADYYDSQVSYIVTNLITLIEPILIFILGAGVLFLALGIFLPIWNLIHVFRG
jgi:type II secretory pathway component PulF